MKRFIALLLTVVLCLSFASCAKKSVEEERAELVASTELLDLDSYFYEVFNNRAAAEQTYNKKMFMVRVSVMNIKTDRFEYRYASDLFFGESRSLEVCLPSEVLATLTNGEKITVLGELIVQSSSTAVLKDAFIVDESYISEKTFDEETVQKVIDDFNFDDSEGNISWDEGSAPFLIENRMSFKKITQSSFIDEMSGKWFAKHYVTPEEEWSVEFKSDSPATVYKPEETVEWKYRFEGDNIYFPTSSTECYEVRKVSEKLVVFYDSSGEVPNWIMYKK